MSNKIRTYLVWLCAFSLMGSYFYAGDVVAKLVCFIFYGSQIFFVLFITFFRSPLADDPRFKFSSNIPGLLFMFAFLNTSFYVDNFGIKNQNTLQIVSWISLISLLGAIIAMIIQFRKVGKITKEVFSQNPNLEEANMRARKMRRIGWILLIMSFVTFLIGIITLVEIQAFYGLPDFYTQILIWGFFAVTVVAVFLIRWNSFQRASYFSAEQKRAAQEELQIPPQQPED